jgi:DHA3 family macrolide efflux protein-like MFS transporter
VDFLRAGAEVLSLIQIVLLAGMAPGSFLTPRMKRLANKALFIAAGLCSSLSLAALWLIPWIGGEAWRYTALFGAVAVMGFSIGVQNVIFSASFLRIVPKEYLGRIGGISNALLCLVMPVGSFICSGAAAWVSVPAVLLIAGVFAVALYLLLIPVRSLKQL